MIAEQNEKAPSGAPFILNRHHAKAGWHFTTEKARVKLKHLYPSL